MTQTIGAVTPSSCPGAEDSIQFGIGISLDDRKGCDSANGSGTASKPESAEYGLNFGRATTPWSPRSCAEDAFNTIVSAPEYDSQKLSDWEIVGSGEWQLALALLSKMANSDVGSGEWQLAAALFRTMAFSCTWFLIHG